MAEWVLDAHGLMVFLEREPGFEKVSQIFQNVVEIGDKIFMTTVNFGEVYYIVLRECGKTKANEIEDVVENLPIDFVDVDLELCKEAGNFKAFKRMSYADCFAAALAKLKNCSVVTGDPEFKTVSEEVDVYWL